MLARITGTLESVEGSVVVVAAGAEAREALVSPALAEELMGRVGEVVTLHTLEVLETLNQGASFTPRLLGFGTREDRRFFEALTKVKGLGPRRALRALAAPTGRIAGAIAAGDTKYLSSLPEIGRKLAEAIVSELGEKAGEYAGGVGVVEARGPMTPVAAQAVAALMRLGESRPEAERLVASALRVDGAGSSADALLAAALASRGV